MLCAFGMLIYCLPLRKLWFFPLIIIIMEKIQWQRDFWLILIDLKSKWFWWFFVKHHEAFWCLSGQLAKGQSEEQHFPWDALAAKVFDFSSPVIFRVQTSVCVWLCSPLLLLCFLCTKHPGQILNWYKSAGLNDCRLLSCCFAGMTFQSYITSRTNKIHGRAAQLCNSTMTRHALCKSMCWKQLWRKSWWDLLGTKGKCGVELELELLLEYSFGGLLHTPSVLFPIPPFSLLLPTSALAPHIAMVSVGWSWSRMCLLYWGTGIAVSSVALPECCAVLYR